ncbi:MAG: hypothetical protein ACYDHY_18810 [Acidiferrobacterales bacterium]
MRTHPDSIHQRVDTTFRVYTAAKTAHAPKWRALRDAGYRIVASWVDEAGEGQCADYAELAGRCVREVTGKNLGLLYSEPGEVLKGTLIELGVTLGSGVPVAYIGSGAGFFRVFRRHPLWREYRTIEDALSSELYQVRVYGTTHSPN